MAEEMRIEHDLLGERAVPRGALYGIHTLRATENFAISGTRISQHPELIKALAMVKEACAEANRRLGVLDDWRADAIAAACREIAAGRLHDAFVVDVMQGGAGTSTNMNANEVIANRALEHLGHPPGSYEVLHPLEHVNASQSTNDVYPTAVRLAVAAALEDLDDTLAQLEETLRERAAAFAGVTKIGRTQLQDAVPMTLGDEFGAWAVTVGEDRARLVEVRPLLYEISLGGTATGTGVNAPPGYAELVCQELARIADRPLVSAADLIEATQDAGVWVTVSGALKRTAVKISKICNDLRLLSSGPHAGFGELQLPAVQAGSSIMPGKVNPVIPEALNQIAFRVVGADVTISLAVEAGQLELNAFGPLIAHELLQGIALMANGSRLLAERCVAGIEVAPRLRSARPDDSVGLATALSRIVGYERASAITRQAFERGETVEDVLLRERVLTPDQIEQLRSAAHRG